MTGVDYADWAAETFGTEVPVPGVLFAASFAPESKWGDKVHNALLRIELEAVNELLASIRRHKVSGAIAEFGVSEGWWLNYLFEATERADLQVPIFGFDSFRGLGVLRDELDGDFWNEGTNSAPRQLVERNVNAAGRPRIRLFEGFFAESLVTTDASLVGDIAYARVDCDNYEPAAQCLRYLSSRLTHGSVLVFDDWPHRLDIGEGRAFAEWVPTVPHLRFEFLFFGTWGHFYIRVWHRDRLPFPEAAAVRDLDDRMSPPNSALPFTPSWPPPTS